MVFSSGQKNRSSLNASPKGIEIAGKALVMLGSTKAGLADIGGLSRSTVSRFFMGKAVDILSFKAICDALRLDWQDVAEMVQKQPEQSESYALNQTQDDDINITISQPDKETLDAETQFAPRGIHYDFQGVNFYSGVTINNFASEQQVITYNFQGASFHSDVIINNFAPEQKQSLAEAAAEIYQLLKQLDKTYSSNTTVENMTVATEAIKVIENKPALKQKIVNALKAGGAEALREFLSHPSANFVISALADWQKSAGHSMPDSSE
jgi:DNA-binding Xre family transcriptional regulator